jgi:hypothetical protein
LSGLPSTIVAVPLGGLVTLSMLIASLSTSLSFERTAMSLPAPDESSATVAVSLLATGLSLTQSTVTDTVAVSPPATV